MRSILDVNVIIALLDPDHTLHERAHEWWATNEKFGWASCPITENGVVRIMSNPGYSRKTRFAPNVLITQLQTFAQGTNHEFWPDDVSLRDGKLFAADRIHGSRQVTDLYLLALASKHNGRLATFDTAIPFSAVLTAKPRNVATI